jgi:hypothetical protein
MWGQGRREKERQSDEEWCRFCRALDYLSCNETSRYLILVDIIPNHLVAKGSRRRDETGQFGNATH